MRAAIVLAIATLGLAGADAWGYCLKVYPNATTDYATWQTFPVQYKVSSNVTDAGVLAAIDAAFAAWGSVECTPLRFQKAGTFDLATTTFQHDTEAIYVFWYDAAAGFPSGATDAYYTFLGHDNTGRLKSASLAINAFHYTWATDGTTTALDVQSQLVTMIGTVIGLSTSNSPTSVMQSSLTFGDISKREIQQDDIDALIFLYEGSTCPVVTVPGGDGCTGSAPAPDGGGAVADGGSSTADGGGTPGDGSTSPGDDGGGSTSDTIAAVCQSKDDCASDEECTAEGKCVKLAGRCTTSTQCGDGKVCTAEGVCMATGDSGCRVGGGTRGAWWLFALMMIALSAAGATRRRGS